MSEAYLVVGLALAVVCAWLGWQMQRLQARLRDVDQRLDARTAELDTARLQLQRLSTEDSLTALPNHEQLLDFIEREWRRARRDRTPLSLLLVDLDDFRSYNRQFGRMAGDDCLRQVGRAIERVAGRAGDLPARYHRDEFAVVLASTPIAGAMAVASKVREAIEQLQIPAAGRGTASVVTASVAVTSAVPDSDSQWEDLDLIKSARHGLRLARERGGNCVINAAPGIHVVAPAVNE